MLAVTDWSFAVRLFRVDDGTLMATFRGHSDTVNAIAFSPDGTLVATGGMDGTIRILHVDKTDPISKFSAPPCYSLAFSPDGKTLAAGCSDEDMPGFTGVYLWAVNTGRLQKIPLDWRHTSINDTLRFSTRGTFLACGTIPIHVIAMSDHRVQALQGRHNARLTSVEFADEDRWLLSSSIDHHLKVWDISSGSAAFTLHEKSNTGCYDRILSMVTSPGRVLVWTVSTDEVVRMWDLKSRELKQKTVLIDTSLHTGQYRFWKAAFSSDGSHVCMGTYGKDGIVLVFSGIQG
jgi:WD40 repeat protein